MTSIKHVILALIIGSVVGGGSLYINKLVDEQAKFDAVMIENPLDHPRLVRINLEQEARVIYVSYSEVTIGQWLNCYEESGCSYRPKMRQNETLLHPVTKISYFDAQEYISWLSAKTDQHFRLPLESEWNYFSRDVIEPPKKLFDDPRLAWAADYVTFFERPKSSKTLKIGENGINQYGLADLKGNVWEWTQTCWNSDYSSIEESGERSAHCGGVRIMAGEHRSYQSELIRDAKIGGCSVGSPPNNLGFRLVLDVEA